jgi:hypothetical protein
MVMSRKLFSYEKSVIGEIAAAISLDISVNSLEVEAQNDDGSVLQILSSGRAHLGKTRVEMAFGVFEDPSGNMKACVWAFGDEIGNLRELDFHNFAPGVGMADLHQYVLKVFPGSVGTV